MKITDNSIIKEVSGTDNINRQDRAARPNGGQTSKSQGASDAKGQRNSSDELRGRIRSVGQSAQPGDSSRGGQANPQARSVQPRRQPNGAAEGETKKSADSVGGQKRLPQSRSVSYPESPERGVQSRKPVSGRGGAEPQGMMRTQTSAIVTDSMSYERDSSAAQRRNSVNSGKNAAVKKTDKKKPKRQSSDEGGNTVVSVIKAVVYIIFVLVISVFAAISIIVVANDVYAFVKSDDVVEVTIPELATLDNVADVLYKNDVIKYPAVFKLYAVSEHDDGKFIAGTYSVSPMMNYKTLLGEFKEKEVSGTVDITIPEGYSTDEIINLFVNDYNIGTREGFVDAIQNYDFDYWFIDELEESGRTKDRIYRLDGYLFPDTYQFYKNSSEVTVITKLLNRFNQIFSKEYRDQSAALGYSVDEMITLASMIEKEAASPSEFFLVSSVFHNRLNNKWSFPRLESDATVLFVIAHDKGERPKTVTPEDLQYETPYNTYKYEGLPPGPIANPSASAMLAALSPVSTDYYYFVANKGKTYFSATKSEHDAYIAKFRDETVQQTTGDTPDAETTAP